MDRANNAIGRTIALNCADKDKSCCDLCTELHTKHRLLGLGGRPNYFPHQ
jgi:hypothetical protein